MTVLEFEAAHVGTDISHGVVSTGASMTKSGDSGHYVLLQIPEDASSLREVYIEIDSQLNGRRNNIACSRLDDSTWVVDLCHHLRTDQDTTRVVIHLSQSLAEQLRAGLNTVASVAPRLVGNAT